MTSSLTIGSTTTSPKRKKRKQDADLIEMLLKESENLEKNKVEVSCIDTNGEEVSTKSFASPDAAYEYIDKQNSKRKSEDLGKTYAIRVVGKPHKDPFAVEESVKLNECQHGDIVRLTGYLRRPGYFKVDTEDAIGASPDRPWVEDVDSGTGFYIDPGDVDDLEVVISSSEFNTGIIQSSEDVEDMTDDDDY